MREHGLGAEAVLAELDSRQARDPDMNAARLFGLVYPTGRDDLEHVIVEANRRFLFGNALNPFKFAELASLEKEVVSMTGALLDLPEAGGGAMTSGGSESIFLSMLVNRERAKAKGIDRPQILAAETAHPAYAKAAHYLGMEVVRVPVDEGGRADVDAARARLSPATAVVIASAFNYPYGVMDPVVELAALAAEHGAGCHVDACIGGFVLPFLERLGREVPPWDFRVPGVTENLADQIARVVRSIRQLELKKAPSVSETLDWARTLVLLGIENIDAEQAKETLHILLKYQTDIAKAAKELADS